MMAEQDTFVQLSRHPLLSGMPERLIQSLAEGAQPFEAAPNEYLGREGAPSDAFYLIRSGHVSLEIPTANRGLVPIQTIGAGDILGWSWLVPPHRWQFDCRAKDAVEGFRFDAQWLRDMCENNHDLGFQLLKRLLYVIANRLAATRVQLLELYQ